MSESANLNQSHADALAWLAATARDKETDQIVAPYIDAAAVLSTFDLDTIQPVKSGSGVAREEALIELTNRCRPVSELGLNAWQLDESVRRTALRRLANRPAMRKARSVNPSPASDPLQEGIDLLINSDKLPNLDKLSLDKLLGVERAARWLDGILTPLPPQSDLAARIERERHLSPLYKIASEVFVDREMYLEQLADYVGTLPAGSTWHGLRRKIKYVAYWIDERPPLHLYGPGGIGKSAVLARFILDHANPPHPQPLPFVYLDFDRAALDPSKPQTILEDAIRQLLIQFPQVNAELVTLGEQAQETMIGFEQVEYAKSRHFQEYENLIRRFCRLLDVISEINDQPVLIVLDTLEEAEYQGQSAMQVTWGLLRDLLERVDRLRIVTAGRSALPPGLPREPVELSGLPEKAAEQFVVMHTAKVSGGPVSAQDARIIVSLVGTVPLSLSLAVRVFMNEGADVLRSTVGRQSIFSRIKAEQQQGMLYRRILNHVRTHDPDLEKVVNPGLILRRITPEIIEKVLAEPCQLQLQNSQHAQKLFDELGREVGLLDPYRESGALWHLSSVRRIMLPELRGTLGIITRLIHEAAARYYHGRPDIVERAEEIYHLLWLGTDTSELDKLWTPDMEPYLRSAYEELDPDGKIWLGDKLNIEIDEQLRAQADFTIWVRQTELRARTLISNGLFVEALEALRERDRPERPSPLYALETDALKLLGRFEEAKSVISAGLAAAEKAGDRGTMLPLVMRDLFLHEAAGDLMRALSRARYAMDLAQGLREPLELLSAGVAVLRIIRKLKAKGWSDREARKSSLSSDEYLYDDSFLRAERERLLKLLNDNKLYSAMRSRPALMLETAAELGTDKKSLLVEAVSLLGISPDDLLALNQHAQQSSSVLDESQNELLAHIKRGLTSRGIGQKLAKLVPVFADFFAQRLAQAVEDSLHREITSSSYSPSRVIKLSNNERSTLENLIIDEFTDKEIELLSNDYLDVNFERLVDRNRSFNLQVHNLLKFAEKQGFLDKFITALERSRPNNQQLKQFIGRLRKLPDTQV